MTFLIYLIANPLALWVAQKYVPGFVVQGGLKEYLIAGILLGLLHLILRPILKLVAFPLIILTLGLFNLVISALLIYIVAAVTGYIEFQTLTALILATLIFMVINFISHRLAKAL